MLKISLVFARVVNPNRDAGVKLTWSSLNEENVARSGSKKADRRRRKPGSRISPGLPAAGRKDGNCKLTAKRSPNWVCFFFPVSFMKSAGREKTRRRIPSGELFCLSSKRCLSGWRERCRSRRERPGSLLAKFPATFYRTQRSRDCCRWFRFCRLFLQRRVRGRIPGPNGDLSPADYCRAPVENWRLFLWGRPINQWGSLIAF